MLKVLIAERHNFSRQVVQELEQFAEVDLIDITQDQIVSALDNYDVFWFRLAFILDAEIIESAKKCKFIICPVTGLDHIDLEACEKKGIKVISLRSEVEFLKEVRATAELTLGLTLSLLRKIPQAKSHIQHGGWDRNLFKGNEIYKKKVGILGFGRLGEITASYFNCLGAEVYYYDVREIQSELYKKVNSMNDLFRISDIVSVHVNLTNDTQHLVNFDQFACMKGGSFFINTSRGQIVNSEALIWALDSGVLQGAAVDVIENEFNVEFDPLVRYSKVKQNLLITPHIGGNTFESFEKTENFMLVKLKQLLNQ